MVYSCLLYTSDGDRPAAGRQNTVWKPHGYLTDGAFPRRTSLPGDGGDVFPAGVLPPKLSPATAVRARARARASVGTRRL